ncbi:hypothetical protein BDW62DRAFT_210847 [Aspergillus aurantiobrunneus]
MTKSKRARVQQRQHVHTNLNTSHGTGKKHRKMSSFAKLSTKNNYSTSSKENKAPGAKNEKHQQQQQQQHRRPIVPFRRTDRILLVGEGDFSFAHSLATHHRCRNLVATCYDSKETLFTKYPQAERNIADILKSSKSKTKSKSGPNDGGTECTKVLFSVDARKLGSLPGGGKDVRIGLPGKEQKRSGKKDDHKDRYGRDNEKKDKGGPWDMICFNFPHVGGRSTDVNRQVRANQELLVAFFKASVPLLAGKPEEIRDEEENVWDSDTEDENGSDEGTNERDDDGTVKAKDEHRTESGQILVTLFEGEPYTLWNIRDLARHSGLRVVTSFRFPWACYRGYSHARTIGEIEGKDGERGGWRGEDREARMYVFELKTDNNTTSTPVGKRKKRPAETDDSDSD